MTDATSQRAQVRAALERGEELTHLDALRRFNCARLAARVCELRHRDGLNIETHRLPGERFAIYRLKGAAA